MAPAAERHDVIVIGGGQAGLSLSDCLKEHGIDHLVLNKGGLADAWCHQRWDSFCLVTPNWQCRLPGYPYRGDDPDGFMVRDEIVRYLDNADAAAERINQDIEQYPLSHHSSAPPDDSVNSADVPDTASSLDLVNEGISTIIWATGFHMDFSWIRLPVFRTRVIPIRCAASPRWLGCTSSASAGRTPGVPDVSITSGAMPNTSVPISCPGGNSPSTAVPWPERPDFMKRLLRPAGPAVRSAD